MWNWRRIFKWSSSGSRGPGLSHIPRSWIHCHILCCTSTLLLFRTIPRSHCALSSSLGPSAFSIKRWRDRQVPSLCVTVCPVNQSVTVPRIFSGTGTGTFFRDQFFPVPGPELFSGTKFFQYLKSRISDIYSKFSFSIHSVQLSTQHICSHQI